MTSTTTILSQQMLNDANALLRHIAQQINRIIIGRREAVDMAVISVAAGGHLLVEDVPGTGKTMLARSLARTLGCSFKRIQLTPDLLPADVTGNSIYNPREHTFEFRPGPIAAQIVLADELNRATPRTQSALLEAMEEHQVTVDGITYALPEPFMVIATQNPIEYEGTFTLPEAQLDRFAMRITIGYPNLNDETTVLRNQRSHHPIDDIHAITDANGILAVQRIVPLIYIDPAIDTYVVQIGQATRQHDDIELGASTRALLMLIRTAQARALLAGRDYVLPDDIKALAVPVLAHRLLLSGNARMRNQTTSHVVQEVVNSINLPSGRTSRS